MSIDNLIIDGTNLEFRIFFIAKSMKTVNVDGEQTSCIYRYLQTFKKLVEKFDPMDIYAAWDKKLTRPSTNFRKELLDNQYKAGRVKYADINEMFEQEVKLIEMLETLGVKNIFPNVLEADDVCAYLSHTLPGKTVVVSVDQDLLQLITPNVSVYNLKEMITYDNFFDKKGMKPEEFKYYKAIKGDVSDNISGLEGYGDVRSKKLASSYNTANLTEEFKNIIERNLKLIDLDYGYNHQEGEKQSYENQLNYVKNINGDLDKFKSLCERYNFTTYLNDINQWRKIIKRNNIVSLINRLQV